jgi:hypothetical protein
MKNVGSLSASFYVDSTKDNDETTRLVIVFLSYCIVAQNNEPTKLVVVFFSFDGL